MKPGELFRHEAFYRSSETGELEAKYLVLLATLPAGDFVARLLTSRSHARPDSPACFHGHPYSSFYLGVLGGSLSAKSWVDLRYVDDFDEIEFQRRLKSKRILPVTSLSKSILLICLIAPLAPKIRRVSRNAPFATRSQSCDKQSRRGITVGMARAPEQQPTDEP